MTWSPIATVPDDREIFVSNGRYVMVGYVNPLSHLMWAGDGDTLLGDATHWTELTDTTPSPSPLAGPDYATHYRELVRAEGAHRESIGQ